MHIPQVILVLFCIISQVELAAQHKVLVFTKTNGYTHDAIASGVEMIEDLGNANGLWDTDNTANASVFTTTNLAQYRVVIWCNTSGNGLLNASQRAAFEDYIANGGGFVGIHAATDTYRDRSWPFYNELVGGIVQSDDGYPNHTRSNHNATMTIEEPSHPTVDFMGDAWNKTEEYYYWRNGGGQLYSGNIDLLRVSATGNNDYDEPRPMSWYKEYAGGRSFYTALGHNKGDYTQDDFFIRHVEEGIKWVGDFEDFSETQLIQQGVYRLQRPGTTQVLESSMALSHNASMSDYYGDNSQLWTFSHLGNNVYTLHNIDTQRYLEVPQADCQNSANVATWISADSNHQKFKITQVDGHYFLKPMHCLSHAIDRYRGANDTNVHLWGISFSNTNQQWDIIASAPTLGRDTSQRVTQQIAIFPNPCTNIISIAGLSEPTLLETIDIHGKKMMRFVLKPESNMVDVSGLEAGVYFITSPSGTYKIGRVVKH